MVIGSRIAATHLRRHGGALINLGSVLSDRAVPMQAAYCASKHAVKGFTNAFRMELEADGAPVSVTLIKPGAIDTMFEEHARSLTNAEPLNPPPVYAPELVARAILHAAEHPTRDLIIGGAGKLISLSERVAPRLTDRIMEALMPGLQTAGGPLRRSSDNLYHGFRGGRERSGRHALVREHSAYTSAPCIRWRRLRRSPGWASSPQPSSAAGGTRPVRVADHSIRASDGKSGPTARFQPCAWVRRRVWILRTAISLRTRSRTTVTK